MPRLLVVDDTLDIQQMLRELLELEGYAVITASDGVEGCTAARAQLPDLVIMDGQMPRCDGYEATRRIKTDPVTRSILVLFCSCWNGTEAREKALNAGADDILERPYNFEEIKRKIQHMLRRGAPA